MSLAILLTESGVGNVGGVDGILFPILSPPFSQSPHLYFITTRIQCVFLIYQDVD